MTQEISANVKRRTTNGQGACTIAKLDTPVLLRVNNPPSLASNRQSFYRLHFHGFLTCAFLFDKPIDGEPFDAEEKRRLLDSAYSLRKQITKDIEEMEAVLEAFDVLRDKTGCRRIEGDAK